MEKINKNGSIFFNKELTYKQHKGNTVLILAVTRQTFLELYHVENSLAEILNKTTTKRVLIP